jgi:hypothetical protein
MSQPGFDQQPQPPHVYGTQPFGQQYGPQAYDLIATRLLPEARHLPCA